MTTSLSGGAGFRGSSTTGRNVVPKGYSQGRIGQFTPEQHQLFEHMFSQVGPESFLGKLGAGDQSQFEKLEAPALRQFSQLQANTANKYSGYGSGSRRSSGFQQEMGQETSDFAQKLQSNRLGLQQNALQQLMQMSNMLLGQRPYEQFMTPKKQPFWKELLSGLSPGIGSALGTWGGLGLGKWTGLLGSQAGGENG